MILTFLGNRYQRSEATAQILPTGQEGMYRGSRYTVSYAPGQSAMNVQLRYRGVQYDR
jgi:hypothetical protein